MPSPAVVYTHTAASSVCECDVTVTITSGSEGWVWRASDDNGGSGGGVALELDIALQQANSWAGFDSPMQIDALNAIDPFSIPRAQILVVASTFQTAREAIRQLVKHRDDWDVITAPSFVSAKQKQGGRLTYYLASGDSDMLRGRDFDAVFYVNDPILPTSAVNAIVMGTTRKKATAHFIQI
jgi:hypothetical protein